ncbi:hypothetical protein [Roseibium alexandrii]|nr:hypothetical protein [Roseibium alexandrii]
MSKEQLKQERAARYGTRTANRMLDEAAMTEQEHAIEAAVAGAIASERNRIASIMALDEYAGREQLAKIAIQKGMDVSTAAEMLRASPIAQAPRAENGKAQRAAMEKLFGEVPAVRPDPQGTGLVSSENNRRADMVAAARQAREAKYGAGR